MLHIQQDTDGTLSSFLLMKPWLSQMYKVAESIGAAAVKTLEDNKYCVVVGDVVLAELIRPTETSRKTIDTMKLEMKQVGFGATAKAHITYWHFWPTFREARDDYLARVSELLKMPSTLRGVLRICGGTA